MPREGATVATRKQDPYCRAGGALPVGGAAPFCTACFDGRYPTDVPLELDKFALERG